MQITVKLFANFRNNRFNKKVRTIAPGVTVGAIVTELAISKARKQIRAMISTNTKKKNDNTYPHVWDSLYLQKKTGVAGVG